MLDLVAAGALAIWLALLYGRGGFWRSDRFLPTDPPPLAAWPAVVAVIPARDEAATIGRAVASVLGQDYPGRLSVIVVDDNSADGTADAARVAAMDSGRLRVMPGKPLPGGWTGKLWAMEQGLAASVEGDAAAWVWFTDADIEHGPDTLRRLVAKAEDDGLGLASLMVKLRCVSSWERLLIPAFVFFFQKLYPFAWIADRGRSTAGAAGGCLLVRRAALIGLGGLAAIRDRVIDDCALAALLKRNGEAIWLGLADRSASLRAYDSLAAIWAMVARTAYAQLEYSPLWLALVALGMGVVYVVPPLAALAAPLGGGIGAGVLGAAAWLLMVRAYGPTVRLYGGRWWETALLPLAAVLYTLMTIDSARVHWAGRGGAWKGRTYG